MHVLLSIVVFITKLKHNTLIYNEGNTRQSTHTTRARAPQVVAITHTRTKKKNVLLLLHSELNKPMLTLVYYEVFFVNIRIICSYYLSYYTERYYHHPARSPHEYAPKEVLCRLDWRPGYVGGMATHLLFAYIHTLLHIYIRTNVHTNILKIERQDRRWPGKKKTRTHTTQTSYRPPRDTDTTQGATKHTKIKKPRAALYDLYLPAGFQQPPTPLPSPPPWTQINPCTRW